MGPDAMILVFWMLSFKPTFSISSFTFIKRLFSSSSLSAIGWCHLHIWGYWYFSWQSWFQPVLPPAQRFSWCTLHIVHFLHFLLSKASVVSVSLCLFKECCGLSFLTPFSTPNNKNTNKLTYLKLNSILGPTMFSDYSPISLFCFMIKILENVCAYCFYITHPFFVSQYTAYNFGLLQSTRTN